MQSLLFVGYRKNTWQKKKNLCMAFVDLEKAFDKVPRKVVQWALRKINVDEWWVSIIKSMYEKVIHQSS